MKIGLYAYQTFGKRQTTAEKGLKKILGEDGPCLDILVAPEYTNIPLVNAKSLSRLDPEVLLIPGTVLVQEQDSIFNRAYVLKNGELITQYDKMSMVARQGYSDQDHYIGNRGIAFFNVGKMFCTFDQFDKTIGIEICSDNDRGIQEGQSGKRPVLKTLVGHSLDMQIVMSCGLGSGIPNAIKDDGYFISVDGSQNPFANIIGPQGRVPPREIILIDADLRKHNDKLYVYYVPD